MKNKRILIIRRAYYPAELHVKRNAETLFKHGFEVDLLCLQKPGERKFEIINGINVHRLRIRSTRSSLTNYIIEYSIFFLYISIKLNLLFLRRRYSVIEIDSMPNFLVFAAFIPKIFGINIILYAFESMPELWQQRKNIGNTNIISRILNFEEKISNCFADKIICCHDMAKTSIIEKGTPERKISVVLNVPDDSIFNDQLVENKNLYQNSIRIVQHGTITENYGIQIVLGAIKILKGEIDLFYDIIGDGEYRKELESLVKLYNIEKYVKFHGFVSFNKMIGIISSSDIGIVPMLWEYQSPNKMFEFIALHKPVIASDRMTFKQYFNEKEVIYFKTGNSSDLSVLFKNISKNKIDLQNYSSNAYKKYENYRWSRMKEIYLGIYNELTNSNLSL